MLGVYLSDLFGYRMTTYKNTLLPCRVCEIQLKNQNAMRMNWEKNRKGGGGEDTKYGRDKTLKTMENILSTAFCFCQSNSSLLIHDNSINDSLPDNHKYILLSLMIAAIEFHSRLNFHRRFFPSKFFFGYATLMYYNVNQIVAQNLPTLQPRRTLQKHGERRKSKCIVYICNGYWGKLVIVA